MFCRTKKVEKMIKELKDEIKELRDKPKEEKEAKSEPMVSYGENVVPVSIGWHIAYHKQEEMPQRKAIEMILAHLGMEFVKEPQKDAKIVMKKKPKTKKAT